MLVHPIAKPINKVSYPRAQNFPTAIEFLLLNLNKHPGTLDSCEKHLMGKTEAKSNKRAT